MRFYNTSDVLFVFCCIPPCESCCYSHESFAAIQEKFNSNHESNGVMSIGYMKARFGTTVGDNTSLVDLPDQESHLYPIIEDDIHATNDNAEIL